MEKNIKNAIARIKKENKNLYVMGIDNIAEEILDENFRFGKDEESFKKELAEEQVMEYMGWEHTLAPYIDMKQLGNDLYEDYAEYTPQQAIKLLEDFLKR